MVLAESSQSYSERDFQMKACISAAGPTPIGKLDISACSNGTSSKRSKASKMSVSETRFVRGGLRATNNELANGETSAELIKKLIKEADEATSPIQYTFMPISSILQTRFKPGSMNYIRATNLEYYYNGFFNYGCHYVVGVWCNCRGKTCVRHKSEKQIAPSSKETAFINTAKWDWKGCNWKVVGSWCGCHNKDFQERHVV